VQTSGAELVDGLKSFVEAGPCVCVLYHYYDVFTFAIQMGDRCLFSSMRGVCLFIVLSENCSNVDEKSMPANHV